MESVGVVLRPRDGSFGPVDEVIDGVGADREALLVIERLSDGSHVAIYRLVGDPDPLAAALADAPAVRAFDVDDEVGTPDRFFLFVHTDGGDPLSKLLAIADRHALLLQRPITYPADGARVTVTGTATAIREAVGALPEEVVAEVDRVGAFDPDGSVLARLTDRQRAAIEAAVEMGYYEVPRRATCGDVADRLDRSTSSTNELLRRAEANLLGALFE
jgi:hypothetical protein